MKTIQNLSAKHEVKELNSNDLNKVKGGDRRRTGRAGVAFRRSRGIG